MILGRSANTDVNNTIIFYGYYVNNNTCSQPTIVKKKERKKSNGECKMLFDHSKTELCLLNTLESHISEQVPRKMLPIMPRQSLSLIHRRTWQRMVISTRPGHFCKSKIVKQIVKCFQKISYCGIEERKKIGTFHHEFGILSQSRDKS